MSARTSLIYLGARAAAGVLSLLAVSLFARGLGPESYAWLALCTTGAAMLSSLLVVPAGQTLARYLPRAGFEQLLPTLARLFVAVAAALMLAALVVESLQPSFAPRGVVVGASVLLFALGLFELSAQFANSRFQAARYAAMFVFKAVATLSLGGFALWVGGGAWSVLAAMLVASLGGSLLVSRDAWLGVLRSRGDMRLLREVRGFALMLACISGCAGLLQWSDRWLLAALADAFSTGVYGATADLVAQTMMMVSSAFFLAWYPRMVAAWESGARAEVDRLAGRYLGMSLAIMLPAAIGFSLLRHEIAALLLGETYAGPAAVLIPWLAAAAALATLRTLVFDVSLFISGRLDLQLRNALLAAASGLALTLWLVPRLGASGAAIANVAGQGFGMLLSWWAGRGLIAWRMRVRDLVAILGASLLMAVLVWSVPLGGAAGLVLRVLLGAAGFGVAMLACDGLESRAWFLQRVRSRLA